MLQSMGLQSQTFGGRRKAVRDRLALQGGFLLSSSSEGRLTGVTQNMGNQFPKL